MHLEFPLISKCKLISMLLLERVVFNSFIKIYGSILSFFFDYAVYIVNFLSVKPPGTFKNNHVYIKNIDIILIRKEFIVIFRFLT